MDIDEDDDFYAPEEPGAPTGAAPAAATSTSNADTPAVAPKVEQDDLEEGEEEDEGGGAMDEDEDDSDIDIITERKDGSKAAPPSQSRYSEIRNIPQRSTSNDTTVKSAPIKKEETKGNTSTDLPPVSTSQIDINAIPIHKGTGKPITQVNIDEDLPDNDKPWRKPGTDPSDYFNYGFDEFTWALYAAKQEALRSEYNQDAVAENNKKIMEDLNNMMMMGGMPGMSMPGIAAGGAVGGVPGQGGAAGAVAAPAAAPGMAAMGGMESIPPDMQAMMQQLIASGIDPSQMDPATMGAIYAGVQGGGGAGGGGGGQGGGGRAQGYGGSGFGGGNGGGGGGQGQGYGYDQQQGMGGGNTGRGGFGRGRGGRRNW